LLFILLLGQVVIMIRIFLSLVVFMKIEGRDYIFHRRKRIKKCSILHVKQMDWQML